MDYVKTLLKFIGKEKVEELDFYVNDLLNKEYMTFNSEDEIKSTFNNTAINKLSEEEKLNVRAYTGYAFRRINSLLRGVWNYELNGALTDEIKQDAKSKEEYIKKAINKVDVLPFGMKAYRGVSLSNFRDYGITKLEDLPLLKNQFLFERGFTSTSLIKKENYANKTLEWGEQANIEIEYLIPENSEDAILLNDYSLSFNPNVCEYLINAGSLFKVMNVEVNNENNTAKMFVALIPQKIWDPLEYEHRKQSSVPTL